MLPECLMIALHAEVPRIAAQKRLDAATAADYPDWKQATRDRWWKEQARLISGKTVRRRRQSKAGKQGAPDGTPSRRTSLFFVNGEPVDINQARRQLGAKLGAGLSG
jgi:hypothetical protein